MSYGITSDTKETNFPSPMQPGINDNVKLIDVLYEQLSEDKDPLLQIKFEDEFGGQLTETVWPINEDQIAEWNDGEKVHKRNNVSLGIVEGEIVTVEDDIKMAYATFNQRLLHIASRYMDHEKVQEATKNARSYAEFCKAYSELFTNELTSKTPLVRMKVVLNNKDYSILPKFPPFIESMDIPRNHTRLQITKYDRIERATVD
ncbi:MAG: hypothetical protein WD512_05805, partial [Candidatus Paceibacterota bacterium]